MKRKLTEIYGLREAGDDDEIDRAFDRAGWNPKKKPPPRPTSVGQMQADVDSATSVVKKEAMGGTKALNLTDEELKTIKRWAGEYREDPGAEEILKKIEDAEGSGGGDTPFSSSSSSSMTRSVGGLKLQ